MVFWVTAVSAPDPWREIGGFGHQEEAERLLVDKNNGFLSGLK